MQVIVRALWSVVTATLYQLATNPYLQALLLAVSGYWRVAVWLLAVWLALHALAVALAGWRESRIGTGRIFTCPDWLFLLGNEQDGYLPAWYVERRKGWPQWLVAFEWAAWRNKLRNLPFVESLAWLHRPAGALVVREKRIGAVTLRVRWRGWMTEVEHFTARRFGDFGPRLDQPDQWGGVSWAFRPWGKL